VRDGRRCRRPSLFASEKLKLIYKSALHALQAHPRPLWQVLLRAMQLSPHAFPREQTLQQEVTPATFVVQARAGERSS
jgi:methylphosphotriester-DNA--protein-cysteine methyltransferase